MKKRYFIAKIIIGVSVFALIIGILFFKGYIWFNTPSKSAFPIRGIDVSNHQNEIDWNKVKEENIKFAFIKATEGGDFKDKRFNQNWEEAKKNNIDVGAYHFFTFCKSGKAQANNFIETVPNEKNNLPPVIDLEYGGNCKLTKTKKEVLKEIKVFERLLFEQYKKKAILYVTKNFHRDFLIGEFPDNPIWYRSIFTRPQMIENRKWLFWQYGNRGHLKGINTYVDLNVFNGSHNEYEKMKK
jgi:lysozyme